jgi:deoxyribodipyrimidine photolyase-related protein
MSDFEKGDWTQIWDALYWRFIHVHRNFFLSNPRMGLMVNSFDKMLPEKQALLLNTAEEFLAKLDQATCKPI